MKRVGGLFEALASPQVLSEALWLAARGKAERPDVLALRAGGSAALSEIAEALRAGTYRFGPYTRFSIRDPKTRVIRAPTFRDRVVHHAMIRITGPVFERGAVARSYACRRGLGQHRALRQAARWVATSEAFLKVDIHRFYDSISHERLRRALRRRFRERRLLALFDSLLDSYASSPGHGLPIGALTSQYLGNFALDGLDHWVLERAGIRKTLRYMDDMLFLGDWASLRAFRAPLEERLAEMGFEAKHGGILNTCDLGVPWLGFVVYPNRIRSSRRGRKRLRRRWGDLERQRRRGRIPEDELQARATALFAHAHQAHDRAFCRNLLAARSHGEAPELLPSRHPRRLLEPHRQEVPLGLPQQEASRQPQPEPGLAGLLAPRHGGARTKGDLDGSPVQPPDVAPSRAPGIDPCGSILGDKSRGRPSTRIDIQGGGGPPEKTPAEGPPHSSPNPIEPPRSREDEG